MRWEKIQFQGGVNFEGETSTGPGKRWGHTCNSVKEGRFFYVFGGYGKNNCQTNQVHVFDTAKHTWSQPVINGTPPAPRDSHTCTAVGDNLFVFGGTNGKSLLNDLHILDTSTHTWITPSFRGEGPEAREGHSATLVGKRLFVFGGCGRSPTTGDEIYYNDVHIFNTETFVWKQVATTGTPPSARDSHTCSSWKNLLIVIAGEDGHDFYLSDVHILDTDTLVWKELSTSGQMLPPRAGHSTVALGKNLFVFAGFTDEKNLFDDLYVLDVATGIWTKVTTTGDEPHCRFSVAGDCVDPLKSGVLVFIGGCNKSLEALDDMYYLHTGLTRDDCKPEKLSMRKQMKLKCQEQPLVSIDGGIAMRQPVPLLGFNQPGRENLPLDVAQSLEGKTAFLAKVTECLLQGYSIETVINGKSLRGILFSNKPPGSSQPVAHNNSGRKRSSSESGDVTLNDEINNKKSKSPRISRENSTDNAQSVVIRDQTVVAPAPVCMNPTVNVQSAVTRDQTEVNPTPVCLNPTFSVQSVVTRDQTQVTHRTTPVNPTVNVQSDVIHDQPEVSPTPVCLNPTVNVQSVVIRDQTVVTPSPVCMNPTVSVQSDAIHDQTVVTPTPVSMNPAPSEPQYDPADSNLPAAPVSLNDEQDPANSKMPAASASVSLNDDPANSKLPEAPVSLNDDKLNDVLNSEINASVETPITKDTDNQDHNREPNQEH